MEEPLALLEGVREVQVVRHHLVLSILLQVETAVPGQRALILEVQEVVVLEEALTLKVREVANPG